MANWISLVALSALAVSTLSLPSPDGAYNIPNVGTGRRSQFFVLHSDGTYKYGHDTGEGAFESARSTRVGQQQGNFGYVNPEGDSVNLQYQAGEGGFVPTGSHIPQAHPDFHAAHAAARARPPFVDPLANSNTDASYDFGFAAEGHTRSEQSDASGNVRGSYSYTDEDGNTRVISYTAGRGTGFVVEGNDLPVSPDTPEASGSTPAATRSSSGGRFSSTSQSRAPSTSPGAYRPPTSRPSASRPSSSSLSSVRASQSSTSFSSSPSVANNDGSYSFSFDSGDHSRAESADANLNVEGQYSFVADDGIRRRVDYEAGANRGFIASGDHLPVAPQVPSSAFQQASTSSTFSGTRSANRVHSASRPAVAASSSSPQRFSGSQTYSAPSSSFASSSFSSSSSSSRVPFEEANTRSQQNPDGSYAFEYETSSHSRKEAGDRENNVDGDFDFVADDGQRRQINYEAGSDTGFIAEGAHIPIGPIVPGAPTGQPTGRIVPVQEVPFVDPLANSNTDASYNFAFESDQYSRSETADADGNVQGTYTVVDDDGTRRTYQFRAGEGVGFETEEVSSSSGPRPASSSSQRASFSPATSSQSQRTSFSSASPSSHRGAFFPSAAAATHSFQSPQQSSASRYSSSSSQRSESSGFQLHQYDASENPDKFGYVLTFDK